MSIDEVFLKRQDSDTPKIELFLRVAHRHAEKEKEGDTQTLIHKIGELLQQRFWIESPEFSDPNELNDSPEKNGVYFNGKNIKEVYGQIENGKLDFWTELKKEIQIEEPEKLVQHVLDQKSNTPSEIFNQQFIRGGGGCGHYVNMATDVLRAANIPTKFLYFLKKDAELTEIKNVANGKEKRVGHYMAACLVEGVWKAFDLKWQWNPKHQEFYEGKEDGLEFQEDPETGLNVLMHRDHEKNGTVYLPVTNNCRIYNGVTANIDNLGFIEKNQKPNIKKFAENYLAHIIK